MDVPSDAKHSPCSVYAVAFLAGTPYLIECAWHEVIHQRTFLREGSCHVHEPCNVWLCMAQWCTPLYLIECAWHEVMHLRTFLWE